MPASVTTNVDLNRWVFDIPATFDVVCDPVIVVNPQGVIVYTNPALTTVAGISSSSWLGANIFILAPDCGLSECLRRKAPVWKCRATIPQTHHPVSVNAIPLIQDGELWGAVACYHSRSSNDLSSQVTEYQQELTQLRLGMRLSTKKAGNFATLVGNNKTYRGLITEAKAIAAKNINILISGEWGTGKELMSRAIHQASSRVDQTVVVVDCAAFSDTAIDIELFGAILPLREDDSPSQPGNLELCNGGTIILKDVGCLSLPNQDKLNNFLRSGQLLSRLNAPPLSLDIRFISTTSTDLKKRVDNKHFREDLYYRLATTELYVPPLRERLDDLDLYLDLFLQQICRRFSKKFLVFSDELKVMLKQYPWPGNLNELRCVVNRAVLTCKGDVIENCILNQLSVTQNTSIPLIRDHLITFDEMEYHLLKQALQRFGNSVDGKKQAAQALNISLATLYNKLKKYHLKHL